MKKAVAGSEYWPKCPFHHTVLHQCMHKGEVWYQCYEMVWYHRGKVCGHKEYGA